jgi:hypothetical protein
VLVLDGSDEDAQLLEFMLLSLSRNARAGLTFLDNSRFRPDMQPAQIVVSLGQVPVLLIQERQRPALSVWRSNIGRQRPCAWHHNERVQNHALHKLIMDAA